MIIRDAVRDDLTQILELICELAAYERSESEVAFDPAEVGEHLFGPAPAARVLVADVADVAEVADVADVADVAEVALAGMALYHPTFSTWLGRPGIWLEDLFVRRQHRGSGYGRALLDAVRDRTDGRVEWAVLDWNEPAIGFYRSLGAEPVAGWTRYRWPPADPARGDSLG